MTACSPAAAQDRMLSVTALPSARPGRVVVEVVGEVDSFTVPLLDACLRSQATRTGIDDLVVDLRRLSLLGGEGVRAVVRAEGLCRSRGARLSVRCGAGAVEHALRLSGLGDLVSVAPPVIHGARAHGVGRRRREHCSAVVPERRAS